MRDTIEAPKTPKAQAKVAAEDQESGGSEPARTQKKNHDN